MRISCYTRVQYPQKPDQRVPDPLQLELLVVAGSLPQMLRIEFRCSSGEAPGS